MNIFWERHPWSCGAVLAVLLGGLVLAVGDAVAAPWPRTVAAGAAAGGVTLGSVAVLGRRAGSLAAALGEGAGARALLGTHPWLTGLLVGLLAGVVRGSAAAAGGEPLAEAAADALVMLVPWTVVLGLLGRFAAPRPAAADGTERTD